MKINIHISTYIFILLSFLSGYFEYVYIFLIFILVHEFGHYTVGLILKLSNPKIVIYPFGGITTYNDKLNIEIYKEFLTLIGGISFQIIFYIILGILYKNNYITSNVFDIIKKVNILLMSFNFLPILPLDGGKLLNLILDLLFSYKLSNIISIIISIIFIIIFSIFNKTIFSCLLILFLIKSIIIEIYYLKIKYNLFLLERYMYNINFNKIKKINNINKFKRDYYHIINNYPETVILHKLFDT